MSRAISPMTGINTANPATAMTTSRNRFNVRCQSRKPDGRIFSSGIPLNSSRPERAKPRSTASGSP